MNEIVYTTYKCLNALFIIIANIAVIFKFRKQDTEVESLWGLV